LLIKWIFKFIIVALLLKKY